MVIETSGLTKMYGKKTGCKDVSLVVKKGSVFGFLGPNGAGKSSFVKMLMGLLAPTSGKAYVLGCPVDDVKVRQRIGYLPELFRFQDWMTGEELLSFHADLYRMDKRLAKGRIDEVLGIVKLKGNEKYRIQTYSKGMQQRLGIAGALLADPELLFLDEPTSALDPIGRREVREIISELKSRDKTVFLNSHLLSEVEMVCDSVSIISNGTIVKTGSMKELVNRNAKIRINTDGISLKILDMLRRIDPNAESGKGILEMGISKREDMAQIVRLLVENGCNVYEAAIHKDNLEDLFIDLIKEGGKG